LLATKGRLKNAQVCLQYFQYRAAKGPPSNVRHHPYQHTTDPTVHATYATAFPRSVARTVATTASDSQRRSQPCLCRLCLYRGSRLERCPKAQQIVLQDYIHTFQEAEARSSDYTADLGTAAKLVDGPLVAALQAMRGVTLVVAVSEPRSRTRRLSSLGQCTIADGVTRARASSGTSVRRSEITKPAPAKARGPRPLTARRPALQLPPHAKRRPSGVVPSVLP
jgi:hypothetical protein